MTTNIYTYIRQYFGSNYIFYNKEELHHVFLHNAYHITLYSKYTPELKYQHYLINALKDLVYQKNRRIIPKQVVSQPTTTRGNNGDIFKGCNDKYFHRKQRKVLPINMHYAETGREVWFKFKQDITESLYDIYELMVHFQIPMYHLIMNPISTMCATKHNNNNNVGKWKIEDTAFSFFITQMSKTTTINTIHNENPLRFTDDHPYYNMMKLMIQCRANYYAHFLDILRICDIITEDNKYVYTSTHTVNKIKTIMRELIVHISTCLKEIGVSQVNVSAEQEIGRDAFLEQEHLFVNDDNPSYNFK